jgi:hypothetical protein
VNKLPYLHTKSEKINFLTVQSGKNRTKRSIIDGLNVVLDTYHARGFMVTDIHGDNEFDINDLRHALSPTTIHIHGVEEHSGIVERSIRTIKERCRSMCHAVPYERYTKLMTNSLIECAIHWLNAFPSKTGIASNLSPSAIVLGRGSPDFNNRHISFGAYAMVYNGTKNNMSSRCTPAIALRPSNDSGGFYFMSLYTGKRLHSYHWEELPISDEVIKRVNELGEEEDQPILTDGVPLFEWTPGQIIDEDDEEEYTNDINEEHRDDDNDIIIQEEDEEEINIENPYPYLPTENYTQNVNRGAEAVNNVPEENRRDTEEENDNQVNEQITEEDNNDLSEDEGNEVDPLQGNTTDETPDEVTDEEDKVEQDNESSEPILKNGSGRPRRSNAGRGVERLHMRFGGKKYASHSDKQFLMASVKDKNVVQQADLWQTAVNVMFTQMTALKGIKRFGESAVSAMVREFTQLDKGVVPNKPVILPKDPSTLTRKEKASALEAVNLIKQKRCGKIKGRTCANGSKQRQYLKEDESIASPTASLEGLFASYVIDVHEGRDTAIFDVPGAYLHAEFPDNKQILLKLRGIFVDIMCEVNPEHLKNVVYENGGKVLYLQVVRALYGCIESALLWYNLYTETLEKMGFKINPYDRCVANKTINGKQCTIVWYVDDNKISHQDPKVVTEILEEIKKHFGELTIERGDEHSFLGMNVKLLRDKKCIEIEMEQQIQEAIDAFGEDINGKVASPAAHHLFKTNDNAEKLSKKKWTFFIQ